MKKRNPGNRSSRRPKQRFAPVKAKAQKASVAQKYLDDLRLDFGLQPSVTKVDRYEETLTNIQAQAIARSREAQRKFSFTSTLTDAQVSGMIKRHVKQHFDDGELDLLQQTVGLLTQALKALNLPIPPQPTYGRLPLGSLDAMAIRVPGTADHLIVFHEGVFEFLHFYCRILSSAMAIQNTFGNFIAVMSGENEVAEAIRSNEDVRDNFTETMDQYLLNGSAIKAKAASLALEAWTITSIFLNLSEIFVLGHELGHIDKGHLAEARRLHLSLGPTDVEATIPALAQEYEADQMGLWYSTKWAAYSEKSGNFFSFRFVGPAVALSAMHVAERALSIIATGEERDLARISHPSPRQRFDAIYQPGEVFNGYPGAILLAKDVWAASEALLQVYRPAARKHFDAGREVHRMWKPMVERFKMAS